MGTHCGDSIPPSGASSNNEVFIIFHSDGTNIEAYAGFKMEYNPTGKQITTIQNNTEYHINRCRILVTFFKFAQCKWFPTGV